MDGAVPKNTKVSGVVWTSLALFPAFLPPLWCCLSSMFEFRLNWVSSCLTTISIFGIFATSNLEHSIRKLPMEKQRTNTKSKTACLLFPISVNPFRWNEFRCTEPGYKLNYKQFITQLRGFVWRIITRWPKYVVKWCKKITTLKKRKINTFTHMYTHIHTYMHTHIPSTHTHMHRHTYQYIHTHA